jgi:uncharacterized membrane protein YgcG
VKNPQARIFVPLLVAALLSGSMVSAQESGAPAVQQAAPAQKTFSQAELDQILAPVALYPDNLLAQILMAATYPLEIIMAARWSSANPGVSGKALEDAMAKQPWDPAVKSLTAVPQVLQQMNDNLEWIQKLGDAALAQREDVMKTVQALRAKAAANGNLKTTPEQVVKTEVVESSTVYVIESSKPDVVYVPTYDPSVVYGYWGYAGYPPYYMYPPGYVYAPGLAFAAGIFVGAAIWGNCNWGGNNWNVNVNHYNSFNRSNISNGNWNHNVDHRRGVAYKDQGVANKYGRGNQGAQTRDSYRGRDQGGGLGGGGRGGGPSASTRDIGGGSRGGGPSAATRDAGGGSRGSGSGAAARGGGRGDGGFGGMSSGSGTRAASSRGGGSYGGRSGGGRSGGGGRRR